MWTPFDYDHEQFRKQIFLLDSDYLADDAATLDKDVFVAFRDRCLSTGEIHRNDLAPGVAPVHQVSAKTVVHLPVANWEAQMTLCTRESTDLLHIDTV